MSTIVLSRMTGRRTYQPVSRSRANAWTRSAYRLIGRCRTANHYGRGPRTIAPHASPVHVTDSREVRAPVVTARTAGGSSPGRSTSGSCSAARARQAKARTRSHRLDVGRRRGGRRRRWRPSHCWRRQRTETSAAGGSPPSRRGRAATPSDPAKPGDVRVRRRLPGGPGQGRRQAAGQARPAAPTTMTLKTNHGDIVVDLDAGKAPYTVNSFEFLAEKDYFDHTKCHRLITDRHLRAAVRRPDGQGRRQGPDGRPGRPRLPIPDENLGGMPRTRAGVVAMANSGAEHRRQPVLPRLRGQRAAPRTTHRSVRSPRDIDVLDKVAKAGVSALARQDGRARRRPSKSKT